MVGEALLKRISSPGQLGGDIAIPGDKSISHRAIILNSLASGDSTISNVSPGKDCLSTANCLKALGAKIKKLKPKPLTLHIHGGGRAGLTEAKNVLNAGNSATTIRLLSGLLAAQPFLSIITGDTSLRSRPMRRLIEPLQLMGAEIYGRDDNSLAPIVIRGKNLHGIDYSLAIPSAQIKSAILLASLFATGPTTVEQTLPSRDHTERLLKAMGATVECDDTHVSLTPSTAPLNPVDLHIPGDISSAAYWLVAGAIHPNARIKIRNCGINPTRTGILDILQAMGAKLSKENQSIAGGEPIADIYIESSELKAIDIGKETVPRLIDEIPVLAVAACMAKGRTAIRGAGELRVKESDRIMTTVQELSKFGAEIEELPDGIVIHGGKSLIGAEVDSHLDHRLAMSLAIASLVASGETTIYNAGVAEISYPSFWQELETLAEY